MGSGRMQCGVLVIAMGIHGQLFWVHAEGDCSCVSLARAYQRAMAPPTLLLLFATLAGAWSFSLVVSFFFFPRFS